MAFKYETKYNIKKDRPNIIKEVKKESIADQMGIKPGYKLISINGENIIDILDYKFLLSDDYLEIEFLNLEGESEIYELEKDYDEDLGLIFETELIDSPKNCRNKCIFCFMNQLPKDVRDTLIFKDDDYRLSFFSGNYITMTNMTDEDIDRIIKYRLSPINISVHSTDIDVRCKMLNNKFAGKVLEYIERLYNAKIHMNAQIVLCKGINDGKILDKTIMDLSKYFPMIRCIGIVPVGLTKHRDNLDLLLPLEKEDCKNTVEIISKYQKEFKKKYNDNVVYLADEFYIKAGVNIPDYKEYGKFENIENGIGMIANFEYEFNKELKKLDKKLYEKVAIKSFDKNINIMLLTGKITEKYITEKVGQLKSVLEKYYNNVSISVLGIVNTFFGEEITVTGLITGSDIINQIKYINQDTVIVIPDVCLKENENIFLDDVTIDDIRKVHMKLEINETSAKGFVNGIYKLLK